MKIVAGLGNPGSEYALTKHNVGFMLVDALKEKLKFSEWKSKQESLISEGYIGGEKVILVKPQTYMNESGRAIGPLVSWYKLSTNNLIVVHDDMDISTGTHRIRRKGSAGGHNGIKSVLCHVQDENFTRVRIGIGRPLPNTTVIKHVLSNFSADDFLKVKETIKSLLPAVESIIIDGVDLAMNRYNPKKGKKVKAGEGDDKN